MWARTSRAREAAAVMSSSVPGMTGLNLPLIGNMPVNQFTLGGLFGPDIGAAPELPPALPLFGTGTGPPALPTIDMPQPWTPPTPPDLLPLLQTAGVQY